MVSRIVKRTALTLLALAALFPANSAFAGGVMRKIPPEVYVSLLRQTDNSGEAVLHLAAQVAYTGCPRVSNLEHRIDATLGFLDIEVSGFTIDFNGLPMAPGFPCRQTFQVSSADIPLDRKLIENNEIKVINIKLPGGLPWQVYDVALGNDQLILTPRPRRMASGATALNNAPLEFRYYPKNILVLTAPATRISTHKLIADFASAHGLTALWETASGQVETNYYIDPWNRFGAMVTGTIDVPVGTTGETAIYARRPSKYD